MGSREKEKIEEKRGRAGRQRMEVRWRRMERKEENQRQQRTLQLEQLMLNSLKMWGLHTE